MNNQKNTIIRQYVFIGLLSFIVVLLGLNYFFKPFQGYFVSQENDVSKKIEESFVGLEDVEHIALSKEDILNKLSTQEKIAQMIAYPLVISEEEETEGFIKEFFFSSKDEGDSEGDEIIEIDNDSNSSESAEQFVDNSSDNNDLDNKTELEVEEYSIEEYLPELEALRLDKLSPGFITIFGSEISSDSAKQKIIEVKDLYKDNLLSPRFAVDHEGGGVQRLSGEGYTILPSWKELCESEEIERLSLIRKSARELKNTGVDIVLAPVLDVGTSVFLKNRVCSDSYAVVAARSVEYITEFNSYGILPVLKHFPGIGNINKDLHNNFDFVEVLVNDVKLYKYVIEESPRAAVMISHAGVINQDSQIPCSLSSSCVSELKNAYPDMLIFSDALEMKAASFNKDNINEPKSLVTVSKEAVLAGNEVLIYGQSISSFDMKEIIFSLSQEYNSSSRNNGNNNFKKLVDQAVLKIIDYKHLGK